MNTIRNKYLVLLGILLAIAGLMAACSSDSPTSPKQEPTSPGSTPPSGTWNISMTASPTEIAASGSGSDSSQITIRVTNVEGGAPPPNDTLILVSTSLGSFSRFETITSGSVNLFGGVGSLTLYADTQSGAGTAVVEARLEESRGSVQVRITTPEGAFISHLEPSVGRPEGGYTVNIVGGGFFTEATATFGGLPAEVLGVSSDSVRVRVPGISLATGETAVVTVGLTIGQGSEAPVSLSLASAFTYAHGGSVFAPEIFSISPTQGPNEGGYQAVIRGANFDSPSQVLFGDDPEFVEATVVSIRSNEIVVVVPAATGFGQVNANSTVDLTIRSLNTGQSAQMRDAFTYGHGGGGDEMFISSMGPTQGPIEGGTLVTIFGFGFDEPVSVGFGGLGQQVISVSGTEVVVRTVAPQRTSCGDISLTPVSVVNIETNESADADITYTYISPVPVLLGVSPASGGQSGGNTVTLTGSNFISPATVRFGESSALLTTVVSSTTTTAVVPPFTEDFNEVDCDDNGDGTSGTRWVATSVDVEWDSPAFSGCTTTLTNAYTYNPSDTSCRNDIGAPADTPPVANFTWSPNPQATVEMTFTDTSTAGSNPITTWLWDFDDGGPLVSGQGPQLYTYASSGDYSVVLEVTDSVGQTATRTQTVTVAP